MWFTNAQNDVIFSNCENTHDLGMVFATFFMTSLMWQVVNRQIKLGLFKLTTFGAKYETFKINRRTYGDHPLRYSDGKCGY